MEVAGCKLYRRWLRRVSAQLPVVDTRSPAQRWPVTWPMIQAGSVRLQPGDLDQLHDLWPDYWPPSSVVRAARGA